MENGKQQSYNAIYADGSFEKIVLGDLINKGGASGKIYLVKNHPQSVVKIFHNTEKSASNRKKLQAMLLNKPNFQPVEVNGENFIQIAWPEALLDDEKGFCVGYMMPLINMNEAVSLDHLMQKAIRKKLKLSESYAYRIFAAYNVASMVTALHRCGHYIIDLKPSNLYVYKENMLVAVVDCDGFSIQGENTRYPAEFVSEEYIYPEGMSQTCEQMGEQQDCFALAVIIFRLLNNGIHPYSGTPKDPQAPMLTIQNRIEQYHYAYGLWPDQYQYPHPYSIHEYFHKETLELFERAFTKDAIRPTAYEWQEHLYKLMHHLKQCKNDQNHVYFTAKGCGLCSIDDKLAKDLQKKRQQIKDSAKIRGFEVSNLSTEKVREEKVLKQAEQKKMLQLFYGGCGVFFVIFPVLYKILGLFKDEIVKVGLGIQFLVMLFILYGFNSLIKKEALKFKPLKNKVLSNMLQIYALIWLLMIIIYINDIPRNLFDLAS